MNEFEKVVLPECRQVRTSREGSLCSGGQGFVPGRSVRTQNLVLVLVLMQMQMLAVRYSVSRTHTSPLVQNNLLHKSEESKDVCHQREGVPPIPGAFVLVEVVVLHLAFDVFPPVLP